MADSYLDQALNSIKQSGLWQYEYFKNLSDAVKNNSGFSSSEYNTVISYLSQLKTIIDPKNNLNGTSTDKEIFQQYSQLSQKYYEEVIYLLCQLLSLIIYNNDSTIKVSSHVKQFQFFNSYYIIKDDNNYPQEAVWGVYPSGVEATISYHSNYGTVPENRVFEYDPIDDQYYLQNEDLPILTDQRATFIGWTQDSNPSISSTILSFDDLLTFSDNGTDINFYAVWQFSASIVYNTEYGIAPASISVNINSNNSHQLISTELPVLNNIENGLYTFLGWRKAGQSSGYLAVGDMVTAVQLNNEYIIELTACWQQINNKFMNLVDLRHFAQKISPSLQAREKLSNKVTSISSASTDTQYPSAKLVYDQLALKQNASSAFSGNYNDLTNKPTIPDVSGKENSSNKVTSINSSSTDTQYPSAKCVYDQLDLKASLASPALTGTPTAPTAAAGTNTTQIATTAFVQNALADIETLLAQI